MGRQVVVPAGLVVRELLNNENYVDWSVWVKTYLMGEDLWDMVESMDEPPKPKEGDAFKYWRSRNASALHAIQISCNADAFSEIRNITSAKEAWDILDKQFNPQPESGDDDEVNIPNDQYEQYERFHKALQDGDRNATKEFITQHPDAVRTVITRTGRMALHVAAMAGRTEIVEALVEKMSPKDLEMKDSAVGTMALTAAIFYNASIKIAECMVKKNNKLPTMVDVGEMMPLVTAFRVNHIEMGRYLYSVTPIEDLMSSEGNRAHAVCLINEAIIGKCYDVALHLLQRCPQLATTIHTSTLRSPVHTFAIYPSGRPLKFWQKWIYESIFIDEDRVVKEIYTKLPTNTNMSSDKEINGEVWSLKRVAMHFDILGFEKIYEMKLVDIQASELLRRMCEEIKKLVVTQLLRSDIKRALFNAVEKGNFEFVKSMLKSCPDLAEVNNRGGKIIFMVAIQCRQAKIFSLIHGACSKLTATNWIDKNRNNMLHMAGLLLPQPQRDGISGAALQMQRELQWLKEVQSIVPPWTYGHTNSEFLTPRQLFTREHKQLLSDGEKWMKETATSCTVVGALIVTIMFAATFTVPGGNDERTGYPNFLDDKTFMLFIISDAISLFSSTTSVLMFLGILTSTYAEDDFLKSLPKKLMIGLGTLFLSIAAMMISFCAAVSMMLDDKKSWVSFFIISLASAPVTLFVLMQFPLLIEIYLSTYGPSIFDRKP